MKKIQNIALAFVVSFFCLSQPLKAQFNPFEIKDVKFIYSAEYQGINLGKVHISFKEMNQLEDSNYTYSTDEVESFYYYSLVFYPEGIADFFVDFWRSEHWLGLYQQKLVNLTYFSQYKGFFKDRKINVVSDLKNQTNINKDTGQQFEAPFPNLNSYTVFLALAFDLLKKPNLKDNQMMTYYTSRDDESKKREFIYSNQSKIKTPAGDFHTSVFKLNEEKYQTSIFVAKEFYYLPVKILSESSRGLVEIRLFEVLND